MYQINEVGLEQIRQQLITKLKPNNYNYQSDDFIGTREQDNMLGLWAADLEQAIDSYIYDFDNESPEGAEVELCRFSTLSGRTEFLSVTTSGINEEIE
tara:strand:+ start:106 stop:399 length:294 start_codon:yes stop_codon:yes gene_type:complete